MVRKAYAVLSTRKLILQILLNFFVWLIICDDPVKEIKKDTK